MKRSPESNARMDVLVGYILLGGVALSVILIASGLCWRWLRTGSPRMDYTLTAANLFNFLAENVAHARTLAPRPRLLVNWGIGVLLLTPYLRVLASTVYFAVIERNWMYTLFTGFVLAVLTYSLFLR